jgi:heme/copper-type cytochrome/quinol oxidase subunit 1
MESFVRYFIRSSLVWLGVGLLLGLWMTLEAKALVYRPAHMHANLLGFVSMMIFGVAYHVLPRFSGMPLRSRRAALIHLWLANAGLAAMVVAWLLRTTVPSTTQVLLIAGGVANAAGGFLFITNIWLTLGAPGSRPVIMRAASAPHP